MKKSDRMKLVNFAILTFALMIFSGVAASSTPARVLIIRHGEKPSDPNDQNLSPKGYQRAQALTNLFQIHPEYVNLGLPSAYLAAKYTGTNAKRAVETITPLANKYGQNVLQPEPGSDPAGAASFILQNPDFSGKTVMVAWVHEEIPQLAQSLGATNCPDAWDGGKVFDRIWILNFSESGVECSDLPESVLPGDSD